MEAALDVSAAALEVDQRQRKDTAAADAEAVTAERLRQVADLEAELTQRQKDGAAAAAAAEKGLAKGQEKLRRELERKQGALRAEEA